MIRPRDTDTEPVDPSLTPEQIIQMIVAASGGDTGKMELPEGYLPPLRKVPGPEGYGYTYYRGPALIDAYGNTVKNADGTEKTKYEESDIKLLWLDMPVTERKRWGNVFKNIGLYGNTKPSPLYDQQSDFNVFAKVLWSASIAGRSWDAVVPELAQAALSQRGQGTGYRPTNIEDIKRAIQVSAQEQMGRKLRPKELTPLASNVQQQEVTGQAQTGQRAASTSTLIEQGVQKQFQPEQQAFQYASFVEEMLKL